MNMRWLRYAAAELIGLLVLVVIATNINTTFAGWVCGGVSMLWIDIVKLVKEVRQ